MVCDRLICNFGITGVRMNAGIDQPCTRSLKGHVVLLGLDLCCCCARCRAEKSVANSFRVECFIPFFFPRRSLIYVGTCKLQILLQKPFISNSWVRVDFRNKLSYTFCSIPFCATLVFLAIKSRKYPGLKNESC